MNYIEATFLILNLFYALVLSYFFVGILREQLRFRHRKNDWQPKVSVMVPARNEAAVIVATLEGLRHQDYPENLLEVLIIDDRSEDDTPGKVQGYIDQHQLGHFRLLRHEPASQGPTFKKNALAFGIEHSSGEVILTIDGDCLAQPGWVSSMISSYCQKTGLVAGLVEFENSDGERLFHRLQALEFAGLVFAGVGAVGNNRPIICNGSNLSYRRSAFDAVGGYAGHDHLPSGDDDLLMQNLHHKTDWEVRYNLSPGAVNHTAPVDTVGQFFNQRARWGSKGTSYPGFLLLLTLLSLYAFFVSYLVVVPLFLAGQFSMSVLAVGLLLKTMPELLIVRRALSILRRPRLLRYFAVATLLQIPYIVIAGFAGFFNLFSWKSSE